MEAHLEQELSLLRTRWADLRYHSDGRWVLIPAYQLPPGWNRVATDVAFQVQMNHPGAAPYGFLTPSGLVHEGRTPSNYQDPAPTQPPFGGSWGIFSWSPEDWQPQAKISAGSNLFTWVQSFTQRLVQGA